MSKSIIDAHGGKIWAENNADRKGATSLSLFLLLTIAEPENTVTRND